MGRTGSGKVLLTCMGPGCARRFARYPSGIVPSGRVYCSRGCATAGDPVRYRRPAGPVMMASRVGGRAVPAVCLPRLAARQRALEMAAPHRTPRPGEGRAT
jgi:hypothetical protein